jgi:hypothetical protein
MLPTGWRRLWLLILIFLARLFYHIAFKCHGLLGGLARLFRTPVLRYGLKLKALPAGVPDDSIRIVSFLCHNDVAMWMWAYASWRRFSGICAPVIILNDGSFTPGDRDILRRWPEVSIVEPDEAERKAAEFYKDHPGALPLRKDQLGPKFTDVPLFVPAGKKVFIFDADLLFFRHPAEAVEVLRKPSLSAYYYCQEEQASYQADPVLSRHFSNLPYGFNSGMLIFERDTMQPAHVERLFQTVRSFPPLKLAYYDQIYYVLLATETGFQGFPKTYATSMLQKPDVLVMKHYHSWMKHFFVQEGLWQLLRHP